MSGGLVVSFATEKGGSKKTTQNQILAEIFASEEYSVCVLDFDPQQTISKWVERRNELIEDGYNTPKIHLEQEFDEDNFFEKIEEVQEKYDVTIIDVTGSDTEGLREVYMLSDFIIIPVTPVQNELETLPSIKKLLKRTQRKHNKDAIVKTMFVDVPTHKLDKSKEVAEDFLKEIEFLDYAPLMNSITKRRKVYSDAQTIGLTGFSVSHKQANDECNELKEEVFKMIKEFQEKQ